MKLDLARFKNVDKLLRKESGFVHSFYPEQDGTVIIPFTLETVDDLYNPTSPDGYREPSSDICSRVEHALEYIPILKDIQLQFTVPDITEEQERQATEVLRNRFALDVKHQQISTRFTKFKAFSLLAAGAIILLFSYAMATWTSINHVFYDTVNICGTFLIWEAADTFFLERRTQRYALTNKLRNYTCEIIFKDK